jgi:valyl-tRNA synthetase
MNVENHKDDLADGLMDYSDQIINAWIVNELFQLVSDVDEAFTTYRFDLAASRIYEFVWNEFCDWYLELAKVNLQSDDKQIRLGTLSTLLYVLDNILRVAHPFIPFITEELWQVIAPLAKRKDTVLPASLMIAKYPEFSQTSIYGNPADIISKMGKLKELIGVVRNLRAEMGLQPATKAPLLIETSSPGYYERMKEYIKVLAKISEVSIVDKLVEDSAPVAVLNNARLMLKVEIDVAAEKIRLTKEIEKNNKEVEKMQVKLNNPQYVERAPADLVAKDTKRVNELNAIITQLQTQLSKLG